MKQLWQVMTYMVALNREGYTGSLSISWKDGVPQHTRTESNRLPSELPGDDGDLVALLAEAKRAG